MREKRPDGNPKIDETDIHMMIQESIGAGWLTVSFDVFFSIGQRKLQQEIDEVVGARQPRLADRPNMPLMESVEFPFVLLHSLLQPYETKFCPSFCTAGGWWGWGLDTSHASWDR